MEEPYSYILLVVITLGFQILLTYFQQRARNKADLAFKNKLTTIEESIKTVNALQIDRGKQIFSEEKDSIIVFYSQLNTWIWEALNFGIANFSTSNIEIIKERLIKMQDASNKTNVAFAKVMLIINDAELVRFGQEAINKTSKVHSFRGKNLLNLHKCLKEQIEIQNRMNRMNPGDSFEPDMDYFEYQDANYEFLEKVNEQEIIVNTFNTNNNSSFKK